jgi:hypothetical protein
LECRERGRMDERCRPKQLTLSSLKGHVSRGGNASAAAAASTTIHATLEVVVVNEWDSKGGSQLCVAWSAGEH